MPASRNSATRWRRRIAGELTEDQFKPLRLKNGLYLQLHAYMLRVAIPYGTLDSRQMRKLAHIARNYDSGYGHFTTRQNIQFNWIKLEDAPDILAELADGRDARDPDQRQLHPQRHRRPIRRRRRRRNRRPAPLGRDASANGRTLPSGIQLPAAQVQDRGDRAPSDDRAAMQLHDIGLQIVSNDAGRARLRGLCRRRHGPHAVHRAIDPRRSCRASRSARLSRGGPARLQPLRPARQHPQAAHQDPGPRARRGRIHAARSRPSCEAILSARRTTVPQAEFDRIAAYFAPPPFETGLQRRDRPLRSRISRVWVDQPTSTRTRRPAMRSSTSA